MSAAILANAGECDPAREPPNVNAWRTHGTDVGKKWEGSVNRTHMTGVFHAGFRLGV